MKKQSLKKLQDELLNIITQKYYIGDKEIQEQVDKINMKKEELRIRREKLLVKNSFANKIKNALITIKGKTAELCEKLLRKEIMSNEIMGIVENQEELESAHDEIVDKIELAYKNAEEKEQEQ